jgi:GDP-L-fucose synthase
MEKDSPIYIAGHQGMVGSAILKNLKQRGFHNFILRSKEDLDLTRQGDVEQFFESERPEYVILAAARVGGIQANNVYRAQFIYDNLTIQNNIIHQSYRSGVKKLLFLGSSCIYPARASQPMNEQALLTGELEFTNEPYAIAKIAGIRMCESYALQYGSDFIAVMPTNLYGTNDNYNLETSHVLPAMIRKFHLGKCLAEGDWDAIRNDLTRRPVKGTDGHASVDQILETLLGFGIMQDGDGRVTITLWGSGNPRREFLHADDLADACIHIMLSTDAAEQIRQKRQRNELPRNMHINIGTGIDLSIAALAEMIRGITGYPGDVAWDASKPDGTYRKLLDVSVLSGLGWTPRISLSEGVTLVYEQYQKQS